MDDWYPIQVKQMDRVGRPDIDKFEAAMMRTRRKKGFFVGFDFSRDSLTEIDGFSGANTSSLSRSLCARFWMSKSRRNWRDGESHYGR